MVIAIIGGGISGLATAFYIKQIRPDSEIYMFEKEAHYGGTMRTENINGFLFETGANGFLSNKPDTLDLVKASGAQDLLLRSSDAARKRYIFTNKLHQLPENPIAFMRTKLLSLPGKLRTLGEIFIPPGKDLGDESLQDFGYRRVGKEFTDIFLNAMSAGIFASAPEVLSIKAAFPAVVKLEQEYGGLFKGMIKKKKKEAGPGGVLMSFKGGVGRYIDHLVHSLDISLHKNSETSAIDRHSDGYVVSSGDTTLEADKVVVTTPAYVSASLLRNLDNKLYERLNAIEYSPISVVGFGYDNLSHPLNGFGLLTTASAGKKVLGILWDSSIFPDRAPEGKKLVRVMIGGQRNPELALQDEETLIDLALEGLQQTMGVDDSPQVSFIKRWERGIPNYSPGHLGKVDAIFEQIEDYPGLYLNSNAYYGIGLNDCVRNSKECAQRVAMG
jgi:oxygen-dependent protoporphyrinogen oxidase